MKRKLSSICAAVLTAMVAMSLAPLASAAEFHSEASHTTFKGAQIGETVLTVNAGTLRCAEVTTEETETTATVTTLRGGNATFKECTAFGFVSATADLNGCKFEASADNNEVNVVNCNSPATFTAFNCWVTIENQTGLSTATYTNVGSGSGRYLVGHANLTGIKYTQHSKTFPGCANGTFSNGTLTGEGSLKGFNTVGEQVGIWKE